MKANANGSPDKRLCWGGGGAFIRDHHGKQIGDVRLFFRNVIMACFIDLVKRLHRLQEHYPGSPGVHQPNYMKYCYHKHILLKSGLPH